MTTYTYTDTETNIYYLVKDINRSSQLSLYFTDYKSYHYYQDRLDMLDDLLSFMFYDGYLEDVQKRINSDRMRSKRLRKRIKHLYNDYSYCYFITYTFSDDYLNSSDADARKLKVKRFIKSIADSYVGNIDYGKQFTEREHYHFVVSSNNKIDYTKFPNNVDSLPITYGNEYILADYVDKFAQHAQKIKQRYIYSRG